MLGVFLGIVARLWLATLRLRVTMHPSLEAAHADVPWVLAFFHGTQFPLLAWRRRRGTVVLVSLSADGAMQARALARVGLQTVRGSSSRGGARGLAALVRRMKAERLDAAFAVDGPRGPFGVAKPGALLAAKATGGVVVPMGSAARHAIVFRRAWDRFCLPLPFTTVAVVLGAPMLPSATTDALADAIRGANAAAGADVGGRAGARHLAGARGNMLQLQAISADGDATRKVEIEN